MAQYKTQASLDALVELQNVISHFPGYGRVLTNIQLDGDVYLIEVDAALEPEQIEHLCLEVVE